MRQVAVFADAGYVYAAGAFALTGSNQPRTAMDLQPAALVAQIAITAASKSNGAQLLRIYWYDGLLGARPSIEQDELARTDNVKVRLGTVTAGQQKGVDSLIVTDLIELARNHAITDAVLLSGDEDLRIGVQIAQSFGVRVHLVGIEPSRGNQSNLLRQEADTSGEWSRNDVKEFMTDKNAVGSAAVLPLVETMPNITAVDGDDALYRVANEIVESMDISEIRQVVESLEQSAREIPYDHDRRLLGYGRRALGRDLDQSEKLRIRTEFRKIIANRRAN